jgi:hypothetical protein
MKKCKKGDKLIKLQGGLKAIVLFYPFTYNGIKFMEFLIERR